jgi:hypothetical protein
MRILLLLELLFKYLITERIIWLHIFAQLILFIIIIIIIIIIIMWLLARHINNKELNWIELL